MVNGEGKTQDGNGMPPAVTVPDPDQVANNSTEMGCTGLSCSHEGCEYQTPKYAGPQACEALKLHIMSAHPAVFKLDTPAPPPPLQGDQPGPSITIPGLEALVTQLQQLAVRPEHAQPAARSEALVRPKVKEGMSCMEWFFFVEK